MYPIPHYSDALRQFPSAALSAYFAGSMHGGHGMANGNASHSFASAAAAAAAAAVVSQTNPFSIDNILASRPRLPVQLSSYYVPTANSAAQAAADFYCKYGELNPNEGIKAQS